MRKITSLLLLGLAAGTVCPAQKAKEEPLVPSATLASLMPKVKSPAPVVIQKNVFGLGGGVTVQLPNDPSGDHLQQIVQLLTEVFEKHLNSVIRHRKDPTIILFDGKVFRPGDELFLGASSDPKPIAARMRVILTAISDEAIEISVKTSDTKKTALGEKVEIPLADKYR